MNYTNKSLIALFIPFYALPAYSESNDSLAFSIYRHTYVEGELSTSFKIRNPTNDISYLIQTSMELFEENINTLDKKTIPFFVTPPLQKLAPDETYTWRVLFTGDPSKLPTDRESLYIAKFRVIPSSSQNFTNSNNQQNSKDNFQFTTIQVLHFKVYYRPKQFESLTIEEAQKKVTFRYDNEQLIVKNNSPIYLSFENLLLNDQPANENELFKILKPFEEQQYNFGVKIKPNSKVTWTLMDELALPLKEQYFDLK